MTPERFAFLCLEAQRIHEESWFQYPGYDEFLERVSDGSAQPWEFGETGYYQIRIDDAAYYACFENREDIKWAEVIYYLNIYVWNDIQDWAYQFSH